MVSLGKLNFSSVTNFSLGNLPGEILLSGAWIYHKNNKVSLDSYPKVIARANSNPKVANQLTLVGECVDARTRNM